MGVVAFTVDGDDLVVEVQKGEESYDAPTGTLNERRRVPLKAAEAALKKASTKAHAGERIEVEE